MKPNSRREQPYTAALPCDHMSTYDANGQRLGAPLRSGAYSQTRFTPTGRSVDDESNN